MSKKIHKVSNKQRRDFLENVAILFEGNVNLTELILILASREKSKKMKAIYVSIFNDINSGFPFWKALEKVRLLPPKYIALISIGESSGKLKESLELVSKYQHKNDELRSKIYSASIYPMMIIGVLLVLGLVMLLYVLPKFSTLYNNLNLELPLITRIIINVADISSKYSYIILPLGISSIIAIFFFGFIHPKTKISGQSFLYSINISRRIIQEIEISRFSYNLGALLNYGVPLSQSLNTLIDSTDFIIFKKFYAYLAIKIENGYTIQQSFLSYPGIKKLFPTNVQHIIFSAERTGKLVVTLKKVSKIYSKRSNITLKNLITYLEPALLIIVWVGVAIAAIAVIFPIYNLVGSFTNRDGASSSSDSSDEVIEKRITIVANESINIYFEADPNSDFIMSAKKGDVFDYTAKRDGWYKIKLPNGKYGWVEEKYVEE